MKFIKNISIFFLFVFLLVSLLTVQLVLFAPKGQEFLIVTITAQFAVLMWSIINRTNVILGLQIKILDKLEESEKRN